jgi:hypothetical protein
MSAAESEQRITLTAAQRGLLGSMPVHLARSGGWLLLPDGVDGQTIADLRNLGLIAMEGRGRGSRRWVRTPLGESVWRP